MKVKHMHTYPLNIYYSLTIEENQLISNDYIRHPQ